MASKTRPTANFSEQENLLLAELGRDCDSETALTKKAKAWDEILTKFNSENPNGIKRNLSQLPGCWRRLKLQSKKSMTYIVVKQEKLVKVKLLPLQVQISSGRNPSLS